MKKEIEIQTIPFSFPSPLPSFFSSTFSLSFYFLLFFSKNGNRGTGEEGLIFILFSTSLPFQGEDESGKEEENENKRKGAGTLFVFISNFFPFREERGDWEEEKNSKNSFFSYCRGEHLLSFIRHIGFGQFHIIIW